MSGGRREAGWRRTRGDMARSRAALNRPELPAVESKPRPPVPQPAPPVEHPVIEPVEPSWFRVMRLVRGDTLEYECIGEFPKLAHAIVFATTERWRAAVNNSLGMRCYDNWRETKKRDV